MQHLDVGQIRQTHLEHIVVLALFDAREGGLRKESYIIVDPAPHQTTNRFEVLTLLVNLIFHVKKSPVLSQANKLTNYCFAGFIDVTWQIKAPT